MLAVLPNRVRNPYEAAIFPVPASIFDNAQISTENELLTQSVTASGPMVRAPVCSQPGLCPIGPAERACSIVLKTGKKKKIHAMQKTEGSILQRNNVGTQGAPGPAAGNREFWPHPLQPNERVWGSVREGSLTNEKPSQVAVPKPDTSQALPSEACSFGRGTCPRDPCLRRCCRHHLSSALVENYHTDESNSVRNRIPSLQPEGLRDGTWPVWVRDAALVSAGLRTPSLFANSPPQA